MRVAHLRAPLLGRLRAVLVHPAHVATGAKGAAGAGDDQAAKRLIPGDLDQQFVEFAGHGRVERVL